MEVDRDGNRYDQYLAENPELREEYDGDYYQSDWDKSGVLEADCLLCHSPTYDWNARVGQLAARNYRWAATVGAGLATIEGETGDGETPTLTYNTRLFNSDGTVSLDIRYEPVDDNCLDCHASPDLKKRGFSWFDPVNPDVHNLQGIRCVDCHQAGLDHQIAKGDTTLETVRDDLDNTMRSCRECHNSGYMGATVPRHLNVPPSHLDGLACETCHVPYKNRTPGMIFDSTHGLPNWDILGEGSGAGVNKRWLPAYERRGDIGEKIVPVNPMFDVWWANRDEEGRAWPLFGREIRAAWERVEPEVKDDNGDWYAEVNTEREIDLMLRTLEETLQGGRFDQVHPVYIKGEQAWEHDESGELISREEPELCAAEAFSISHNVASTPETLGATGCSDCHSTESTFFARPVITDPFNEEGEPVTELLGISNVVAGLFSIHFAMVRPWVWLLAIATLFAVVLHFIGFGPHEFLGDVIQPREDDREMISRFNWLERFVHLTVLTSFAFLALSGFAFAVSGGGRWLHLFFGDLGAPRRWHGYVSVAFGAGLILMAWLWWRDSLFRQEDREWFKTPVVRSVQCGPEGVLLDSAGRWFPNWYQRDRSLLQAKPVHQCGHGGTDRARPRSLPGHRSCPCARVPEYAGQSRNPAFDLRWPGKQAVGPVTPPALVREANGQSRY